MKLTEKILKRMISEAMEKSNQTSLQTDVINNVVKYYTEEYGKGATEANAKSISKAAFDSKVSKEAKKVGCTDVQACIASAKKKLEDKGFKIS